MRKRLQSVKSIFMKNSDNPVFLARSVSAGIYIAFSPFLGFHTILVFLSCWMFSLSFPVVFAVSFILHNPWTMFFVYSAGYFCGLFLCSFFSLKTSFLLPFAENVTHFLPYITMTPQAVVEFLIGSNVLGIGMASVAYPFVKYSVMFYNKKNNISDVRSDEDHSAK